MTLLLPLSFAAGFVSCPLGCLALGWLLDRRANARVRRQRDNNLLFRINAGKFYGRVSEGDVA
jgi:hypothetical protein